MSQVPPPPPGPGYPHPPPGQYYAGMPPKKNNTVWIILAIFGVILLVICGGIGFGVFKAFQFWGSDLKPGLSCVVNFEYVRNAIVAYANDHKGKLPKAETWQDDIKSYYTKETLKEKNDNPFDSLNPEGNWECTSSGNKVTGFAFNSDLSGKNLSDIKDPEATIVVFEVSELGRNLHQSYTPKAKYDSPKIFGSERGWIAMPITGPPHGLPRNMNITVNGKGYNGPDSSDSNSDSGDTGSSSSSGSSTSGSSKSSKSSGSGSGAGAGDDSTN